MKSHALQITSDDHGQFRWVLLHVDGERVLEHSHADLEFDSYEAALNAGTLALAASDGGEYDDETAHCPAPAQPDNGSQQVTREFAGR